ncbi:MAG TPA: hypothetical protein VIT91_16045, partial [Chthoniobacterales bacterium]
MKGIKPAAPSCGVLSYSSSWSSVVLGPPCRRGRRREGLAPGDAEGFDNASDNGRAGGRVVDAGNLKLSGSDADRADAAQDYRWNRRMRARVLVAHGRSYRVYVFYGDSLIAHLAGTKVSDFFCGWIR